MHRWLLLLALTIAACKEDRPAPPPPPPEPPPKIVLPAERPPPPPPPPPPAVVPPADGTFRFAPKGVSLYTDDKLTNPAGEVEANGIVLVSSVSGDKVQIFRANGKTVWAEAAALEKLEMPVWIRGLDGLPELPDCSYEPPLWSRAAGVDEGRLRVEIVATCSREDEEILTVHTVPIFPRRAIADPDRSSSCERPMEELLVVNQSKLTLAGAWPEHYAQCDRLELRETAWSSKVTWVSYPRVVVGKRTKRKVSGYLVNKTFVKVARQLEDGDKEVEPGVFVAAGIGPIADGKQELVVYRFTTSPASARKIHTVRWAEDEEAWEMAEPPDLVGARGSKCTYAPRKRRSYKCEMAAAE